jgi:aldehyde:ferredoxin oxidoreductase
MRKEIGIDPPENTTEEQIRIARQERTARFEKLIDPVHTRRGWTPQGVPTDERIRGLGIGFPEVLEAVKSSLQGYGE